MPRVCISAARRALEAGYGLALVGIGEEQIDGALTAAWTAGEEPTDARYLERVVDLLPIDESWLFREDALWTWIEEVAGREILDAALAAGRPARVLSLGCSAGQEPFSTAIVFQRLLERSGIPASAAAAFVQVVGIDSSPARIEAARSGLVPGWSVQRCRPDWLGRRAVSAGDALGRYRMDPSVVAMCRFEVGNLLDVAGRGGTALGGFDLVLCRHVLIYFRPEEAERIAERLGRGLDPGAILVFSAAEAHLLANAGAEGLGHLGAGRPKRPRHAPPQRVRRRGTRPARPQRPPRAVGAERTPRPAPHADAVAAHIRAALEHTQSGGTLEALREARAALFHDSCHLYARLILGEALIRIDERRGREVLRELLEAAARLPPDAAVPCADGLSVGQLAAAVRFILVRAEAR